MENESKSETPETDAVWEKHSGTNAELAIDAIALCGKLERQRNEEREIARNADLRVTRAKRERDTALTLADTLRKVVRHCRLFIVDRKGYIADESLERELITQEIDAILSENAYSGDQP